jgi:hypothetical protein
VDKHIIAKITKILEFAGLSAMRMEILQLKKFATLENVKLQTMRNAEGLL